MRNLTIAVALLLVAVVVDDVAYLVEQWAAFRPKDVTRHLQFHVFVLSVVAWISFLTVRAWGKSAGVHLRLLISVFTLVACIGIFLLLAPEFEKAAAFNATSSVPSFILCAIFLVAGLALVFWSWRVSDAQPCNPPDLAQKAAQGQ